MSEDKLVAALREWVREAAGKILEDELLLRKWGVAYGPAYNDLVEMAMRARGGQLHGFVAFMNGYMGGAGFMEPDDLRRLLGEGGSHD